MMEGRSNASATVYNDSIYVFGGEGSPDTAEKYDIMSDIWIMLEERMPRPRCDGAIVLL